MLMLEQAGEARVFNETPINPRKCAHILTKILYLINQLRLPSELKQGEHLGTTEATEAFFAMTKLFQSNDVSAATPALLRVVGGPPCMAAPVSG
ncbi:hypothetical protein Celaphus_00010679 [Cervus elaphus hippelaphus]|uniref:Uncharacterized protein n=1 Tax=Cervus elaphus hippelaphus TaxID=46360 RepID=A0A212C9F8_CEREH|nr:hypothetical protein Celaphus_00010679 [Cervus elaphus hippelaphus]